MMTKWRGVVRPSHRQRKRREPIREEQMDGSKRDGRKLAREREWNRETDTGERGGKREGAT